MAAQGRTKHWFAPGTRSGDASIGVALTAASVPLWMQLSLMDECRGRVEQALSAIAAGMDCEPRREMKLHAALAASLTYAGGVLRELDAAWTKTLELAEQLDDAEYQLRAVWELWTLHRVNRWHRAALTQAERYCALAANRADPNHRLIGERMLGISQSTAEADWTYAKAWLKREVQKS